MHGLEMSVVIDLAGKTARGAERLRNELLEKLNDPATSSYSFSLRGAQVYPILGTLVKIDLTQHGSRGQEIYSIFEGLSTKTVQIKENGTDHFPTAGLYHHSTLPRNGISGATATVRWKLEHTYPLSEDMIETIVRNAYSSSGFRDTIRLEVPVAYSRSWSLTLTGPTIKKSLAAYELLRNGIWEPKSVFVDKLPDMQKFRLLQQSVTAE